MNIFTWYWRAAFPKSVPAASGDLFRLAGHVNDPFAEPVDLRVHCVSDDGNWVKVSRPGDHYMFSMSRRQLVTSYVKVPSND